MQAIAIALSLLAASAPTVGTGYSWTPDSSGGYGLYLGPAQIGYLWPDGRYYPRYAPGQFGAEEEPPVCRPGPDQVAGTPTGRPCFGVTTEKVRHGETILDGRRVAPQRALAAIGGAEIPDDAAKLRLTVIGTESERKQVLTDLKSSPALAEWGGQLAVQEYAPGEWPVQAVGFKTDGHPTIYVQSASGKVLHRQDDYEGGAERLAAALRRLRPNYDPLKDPGGPLDLLSAFRRLRQVPTSAYLLGGMGVLALLMRRKQ